MPRQNVYTRAQASVVFDGQVMVDVGTDNAIRLTGSDSNSSRSTGINNTIISISSDKSGSLEIDLLPTSSTLERIYPRYDAQLQGLSGLFSCEITTGVGEIHSCQGCAIRSVGAVETGGETASIRTVIMDVAEIQWDAGNN